MTTYYTYVWLREDGSPWYVGKGKGRRAFERHAGHWAPKDLSLIRVYPMLDEATAFAFEMYLIDFWGRKDIGTGILRNRTNGGEGVTGASEEAKERIRQSKMGNTYAHGKLGKKHPRKRSSMPMEFRVRMREIRKSQPPRKQSPETRQRISDATRRRFANQTAEQREAWRELCRKTKLLTKGDSNGNTP